MDPGGIRERERSFATGVVLTVVTLGVYAVWWHYKSYRELHEEFYLREFPRRAFYLSLVPVVGLIGYLVYMDRWIEDLSAVRTKMRLPLRISLASHVGWTLLGALVLVGPLVAYHRLQEDLNEIWETVAAREARDEPVAPVLRV